MGKEIIDTIKKDGENVRAAFQIGNSFEQLKFSLMIDFAEKLKVKFEQNFADWELTYPNNVGELWTSFTIKIKGNETFGVYLQFQERFGKIRLNIANANRDRTILKTLNSACNLRLKNIKIGQISKPESLYEWGIVWSSQFEALTNFFNQDQYKGWTSIADSNVEIYATVTDVLKDITNLTIENGKIVS